MPPWLAIVAVPSGLLLLLGILLLSQLVEQRVLSPQAMVRTAARARRTRPEYAELFVAAQLEPVVRSLSKPQ